MIFNILYVSISLNLPVARTPCVHAHMCNTFIIRTKVSKTTTKSKFFHGFLYGMLRERDTEKESAEAERLELMRSLREEGKSYREIGEVVDCSPATVHKYLTKLD